MDGTGELETGAVACPHCGGAIKPAAKLCKHCKRSVDASTVGTPTETVDALLKRAQNLHYSKRFDEAVAVYEQIVATFSDSAEAATAVQQLKNLGRVSAGGAAGHVRRDSAPMPVVTLPAPLPPVLVELRSFLASKQLVDLSKVDQLLASRNMDDAAALLRQLAVFGHVTQVQAEALVGEFHQRQMATARGVIETARARGLVPASHVEQALGSYAPMAFGGSIHDHLVGSGLLTREQADGLHRSGTGTGKGVRRVIVASLVIVAIGVVIAIAATRKGKLIDEGGLPAQLSKLRCGSSMEDVIRAYPDLIKDGNDFTRKEGAVKVVVTIDGDKVVSGMVFDLSPNASDNFGKRMDELEGNFGKGTFREYDKKTVTWEPKSGPDRTVMLTGDKKATSLGTFCRE